MDATWSALILDDDPGVRQSIRLCLEVDGVRVLGVGTSAGALDALERSRFDVVFLDLWLKAESGLAVLPEILRRQPGVRVIVITAYASYETAVEAMKSGAADYLPKPFTPEQVRNAARRVVAERVLKRQLSELRERIDETEGEHVFETREPAYHAFLQTVQRVAASDSVVLLRGESGTGKTVLARWMRGGGRRADRPFVTVHCPMLSDELMSSTLFGHCRGAFTGAVADATGKVEEAEGGTLFLDEVGDLSLDAQARLLRFLNDRTYERLGETKERRADVRIIAATNRASGGRGKGGPIPRRPLLPPQRHHADYSPAARSAARRSAASETLSALLRVPSGTAADVVFAALRVRPGTLLLAGQPPRVAERRRTQHHPGAVRCGGAGRPRHPGGRVERLGARHGSRPWRQRVAGGDRARTYRPCRRAGGFLRGGGQNPGDRHHHAPAQTQTLWVGLTGEAAMTVRNLRTRFVLTGCLLAAVLTACGAWSAVTFAHLAAVVDEALENSQETIDLTATLSSTLEREDDALLMALAGGSGRVRSELDEERRRFEDAFARLRSLLPSDEEQAAADDLRRHADAYRRAGNEMLESVGKASARETYHERVNPALRRTVADCGRLREQSFGAMRRGGIEARTEPNVPAGLSSGYHWRRWRARPWWRCAWRARSSARFAS